MEDEERAMQDLKAAFGFWGEIPDDENEFLALVADKLK